jgi:cytochrome c556
MKIQLFAAAAIVAMGLAACGDSKPAETPVSETPAPAPAPETPVPAPAASIGETPADPAAFMKARHERYEDLGKTFKVLLDATKADKPDMAAVTAAADKVKEYADQMGTWFPPGTGPEVTGVHTHAKPVVWTDREMFNTKLAALQAEAPSLRPSRTLRASRRSSARPAGLARAVTRYSARKTRTTNR